MPYSRIKLYIDIIKTLTEHGPLSKSELAQFLKVKPTLLKAPVNFFIDQAIIREKEISSNTTYVATKKSNEILRFFNIQPTIRTRISEP
jgi:hypothetical protein